MDGRFDWENPPEERLDVPVDGRVDADGRLDAPVDGRVDADGRFDVPADGRFADPLPYLLLALLLATVLEVFLLLL